MHISSNLCSVHLTSALTGVHGVPYKASSSEVIVSGASWGSFVLFDPHHILTSYRWLREAAEFLNVHTPANRPMGGVNQVESHQVPKFSVR